MLLNKLTFDQISCSGRSGTCCQYGVPKWYEIVKRLETPVLTHWIGTNGSEGSKRWTFEMTTFRFYSLSSDTGGSDEESQMRDISHFEIDINKHFDWKAHTTFEHFNLPQHFLICWTCQSTLQELSFVVKFLSVAYAENFREGFHSVAYGGHLFVVCRLCDVTIWSHIHVSKPTFWRSLLT